MEQLRPIIIKYIYIAAITLIFLTYLMVPSVALGSSLVIALFITLLLYYAGDRFMLPRFGALATAIGNFVIAALAYSVANLFVREPISVAAIFAAAAVIGVVEWFYFRFARGAVGVTAGAGGEGRGDIFPFIGQGDQAGESEGGAGFEGGPAPEQEQHQEQHAGHQEGQPEGEHHEQR